MAIRRSVRDTSLSDAAAIISERGRNDPRFQAALRHAFDALCEMGPSTEALKQMGGMTSLITTLFEQAIGGATIRGSKIFGDYPLRLALTPYDIQDVRNNYVEWRREAGRQV